eukprot:gnl/TRDRNA2_/TRDRNA2_57168_c0_seq1.p1 gnl/TRDRNA2_/TRDRNA2_57168_c0~~gnl/TRDRNA2_/TRDRNA2_57168_c0_seq1.p1  ORF type:complete len:190 (+),score=45.58 gnl/TRDRNA2_/TRDRNA2_57168_c0_seq1:83-652(+)
MGSVSCCNSDDRKEVLTARATRDSARSAGSAPSTCPRQKVQSVIQLSSEPVESLDAAVVKLEKAMAITKWEGISCDEREQVLQEAIRQCEESEVCKRARTDFAADLASRKKVKVKTSKPKTEDNAMIAPKEGADDEAGETKESGGDVEAKKPEKAVKIDEKVVRYERTLVIAQSLLSGQVVERLARQKR